LLGVAHENAYLRKNVEHLRGQKRRLEEQVMNLEGHARTLDHGRQQYRLLYEQAQREARCRGSGDQELSSLHEQLAAITQLKDALNEENVELLRRLDISERRRGEESKLGACVICMDNLANVVCLPCKHLAICEYCEQHQNVQHCPICRTPAHDRMKIFMP